MGEINVIMNEFLADNERFADLFNVIIFGGKQVVSAKDLSDMDTKARRCGEHVRGNRSREFVRDHLKRWKCGSKVVLLGLEPEDSVHYALPVKVMNYESIQYDKDYKETRKQHWKEKNLTNREYISGFSGSDRLIPVITIVLYHGKERWDAPKSISEMLGIDAYPREIQNMLRSYCNDFRVNLVDVNRLTTNDVFVTDLREVFGFLRYQNDREALRNYVNSHKEFTHLSQDTYDVIASLSGTRGLDVKKQEVRMEGEMDMCLAIDEMVQEGMEKGMGKINLLNAKLIADGRLEDVVRSADDEVFQKHLMDEYGISRRIPRLFDSGRGV